MVQFAGKYAHDKNENFEEYLKGFGAAVTPEAITQYVNSKPTLEVKVDGDKYEISGSSQIQKFTIGQTYKDDLYAGAEVESTATLSGNKIEIKSVSKKSGNGGTRVYEFLDDGLIVHYTLGNVQAKRYYKRV